MRLDSGETIFEFIYFSNSSFFDDLCLHAKMNVPILQKKKKGKNNKKNHLYCIQVLSEFLKQKKKLEN